MYALQVPNTALKGFDAGKILSVAAVDVTNASIQLDLGTGKSQSDWYSFQGQAGDLINIQTLSTTPIATPGLKAMTPAAMTGVAGGLIWTIQQGTLLVVVDSTGANLEAVQVID